MTLIITVSAFVIFQYIEKSSTNKVIKSGQNIREYQQKWLMDKRKNSNNTMRKKEGVKYLGLPNYEFVNNICAIISWEWYKKNLL